MKVNFTEYYKAEVKIIIFFILQDFGIFLIIKNKLINKKKK